MTRNRKMTMPKRIMIVKEKDGKDDLLIVAGATANDVSEDSIGLPTGIYELVEIGTVTCTKQFLKQ